MSSPCPTRLALLSRHATRFRQAMETVRDQTDTYAHLHYRGSNLHTFPTLWCDYTSEMLNAYLKLQGFNDFQLVTAFKLRGTKCHVWLTDGEIVIDITGDQFGKRKYPKVLICPPHEYLLKDQFKKIVSIENITHTHLDPVQQKQHIYAELLKLLDVPLLQRV